MIEHNKAEARYHAALAAIVLATATLLLLLSVPAGAGYDPPMPYEYTPAEPDPPAEPTTLLDLVPDGTTMQQVGYVYADCTIEVIYAAPIMLQFSDGDMQEGTRFLIACVSKQPIPPEYRQGIFPAAIPEGE